MAGAEASSPIPTPCPTCGIKLALGPEFQKRKVRCPRCGCRFIAGTDTVLTAGTWPAAPEAPGPPAAAGPRKVSCVLCGFQIETSAPRGTALTCAMCNTLFSEPEPSAPSRPGPSKQQPPPPRPPPKPEPPKLQDETETPPRPVSAMLPSADEPARPSPPPRLETPPNPSPAAAPAPTEQAPREAVPSEPLAAPASTGLAKGVLFNRPFEVAAAAILSGLLCLASAAGLVLLFAGVEGPARSLFGAPGASTLVLPLVTIGCALAALGAWQREAWGWLLGVALHGGGTLYFAVLLGRREIVIAGVFAAVCLILLVFSRLGGRYA